MKQNKRNEAAPLMSRVKRLFTGLLAGTLILGVSASVPAQIIRISGDVCPLPLKSPEEMVVDVEEFELYGLMDPDSVLIRYTKELTSGENEARPSIIVEEEPILHQFGLIGKDEFEDMFPDIDLTAYPDGSSLQPVLQGTTGEEARAVQQDLIRVGTLAGGADGVYGNGTANAVRTFQAQNNLEATGNVDVITRLVLLAAADGTINEVLDVKYPYAPPTPEDKFGVIYSRTFADLTPFMDKSWSFAYDTFTATGSISQNLKLGGTSVASPAIDKIALEASLLIRITYDAAADAMRLTPVLAVQSRGAYLPYISAATLSGGGIICEIDKGVSSGTLDGATLIEDAYIPLTETALDFIAENNNLAIRLKGSYQSYDMAAEADDDALESFIAASKSIFQTAG